MNIKNKINLAFFICFFLTIILSILFFYGLNSHNVIKLLGISADSIIYKAVSFFSIKKVFLFLWFANLGLLLGVFYFRFIKKIPKVNLHNFLLTQERSDKLISYMITNSWGDIEWVSPIFGKIFNVTTDDINNNVNFLSKLVENNNIDVTSLDRDSLSKNLKYKRTSYIDISTKLGASDTAFRLSYILLGDKYVWQVTLIKQDFSLDNSKFIMDVIENLPLPVGVKDRNGKLIYSNLAFIQYFGTVSIWDDLVQNVEATHFLEDKTILIQKSLLQGQEEKPAVWAYVVENANYPEDTTSQYARSVIVPIDDNNFLLQDILLNKLYETIIQKLCLNAPFPAVVISSYNEDGEPNKDNIIELNLLFSSIFNVAGQDNNQSFAEMVSSNIDHIKNDILIWIDNPSNPIEIEIDSSLYAVTFPEGSKVRHFKLFALNIDSQRNIIYFIDISKQKELEAQARLSQGLQTIGQIASTVAHDFNNLLTAIMSFNHFAQEVQDEDSPVNAELEQIKQNSNRAKIMIKQLLTFSRKQDLNPVEFNVNSEISDLMSTILRLMGEKIVAKFKRGKNIGNILLDKVQFQQIITNLIVNAKDSMKIGGKLEISTSMKYIKDNKLTALNEIIPEGEYVTISIADEGMGIPKENMLKIFQSHFSTKGEKGNGLGLFNVKQIVSENAGFIDITSIVGEGTTFALYFPLAGGIIPQEDIKEKTNIPLNTASILTNDKEVNNPTGNVNNISLDAKVISTKKKLSTRKKEVVQIQKRSEGPLAIGNPLVQNLETTAEEQNLSLLDLTGAEIVLLVEDELPVRMVCARLLKSKGYNVIEAHDGEHALEVLEERNIKHIDLVISDVMMPGITGPELVSRLKEMYPKIKSILISGYTEDVLDDINADISIKGINFLEKPFTPDVFAQKVRQVINES